MGLSSGLRDVSGGAAPLPLLILASLASALASLFSVACSDSSSSAGGGDDAATSLFPGLAELVALADYLAASRVSTAADDNGAGDGDCCTVCLSEMAGGERVRTLACRHAFHAACLDGWFDRSSLSCPLCRAGPPAAARDDAGRRAGEDAVAWFARF